MEMATQGGLEQHIPAQATTISSGLLDLSYDPTTKTGVGKTKVFAPIDFFIFASFLSLLGLESCAKTDAVTSNPMINNPAVIATKIIFISFLLYSQLGRQ
jgi:hypothetical protein